MCARAYFLLISVLIMMASTDLFASEGKADLPAAAFLLSKERIDEYRPSALAGDREKALAIYNHYSLFEDNEIDAEFWLRVLAEHDDCYALKEYTRRAKATPRLNTEARLLYWKERELRACQK